MSASRSARATSSSSSARPARASTFIRLLIREQLPTAGSVRVAGRDLLHMQREPGAGAAATHRHLRGLPTAAQQDGLGERGLRARRDRHGRRDDPAARAATPQPRRPRDHAHHLPTQLSGGEQQRTAIARALVHDPAILAEPTGNLDPVTSWEIIQLLIQINELGTTVLMATQPGDRQRHATTRARARGRPPRSRRVGGGLRAGVLTDGLRSLRGLQRRACTAGVLAQRDDEPRRHRDRHPDARPPGGAPHRHRRPELGAGVHRGQGRGHRAPPRRDLRDPAGSAHRRRRGHAGRRIGRLRLPGRRHGAAARRYPRSSAASSTSAARTDITLFAPWRSASPIRTRRAT